MDVIGSSTPIRVNAGVESKGFTFRETVTHASVQDSRGVVDTSRSLSYRFLTHFHSALAFFV